MSGFPVVIDGSSISAVVVGGGAVGSRRAAMLLAAGARVHVVSLARTDALDRLTASGCALSVSVRPYAADVLEGGVTYVVAATNDRATDLAVASDARARGLLVNVAGEPAAGTCVTPAVHRSGCIVIAASAGVPRVASRIRDRIASIVDDRFGRAAGALGDLRRDLLSRGEKERWLAASESLIPADFCESVENGAFWRRLAAWD